MVVFLFSVFPCISVFGMQVSPQFSFVRCVFYCLLFFSAVVFFSSLVWCDCLGWDKYNAQCFRQFYFSQENEHIYGASNLLLRVLWPRHCMCEHENNYFLCYASPQNKSTVNVLKTRERERESKITMSGAK